MISWDNHSWNSSGHQKKYVDNLEIGKLLKQMEQDKLKKKREELQRVEKQRKAHVAEITKQLLNKLEAEEKWKREDEAECNCHQNEKRKNKRRN